MAKRKPPEQPGGAAAATADDTTSGAETVASRSSINAPRDEVRDDSFPRDEAMPFLRLVTADENPVVARVFEGSSTQGLSSSVKTDTDTDADARTILGERHADLEFCEHLRIIEAVLFASPKPLSEKKLADYLPPDCHVTDVLCELQRTYEGRGVVLTKVAGRWMFRTADDLRHHLRDEIVETRKLSQAALETLAIIAYHQPATRAEIEEIRGVSTSSGTLDILLETGWVKLRGRRRAPGRPVTYATTDAFLEHFGLDQLSDLPGLSDLKGAGLLDATIPQGFDMPNPTDVAALMDDELPLEGEHDARDGNEDEFSDGGNSADGKPRAGLSEPESLQVTNDRPTEQDTLKAKV